MPVFLDVSTKIGGIKTLIRSIDISDKTEPEVSEIIAKQHSLLDGCDCILRRTPEVDSQGHTRGPWSVHLPGTIDKRLFVMHPDDSRIIAGMNEGYVSNNGTISQKERIANATLIAASPELLSASKGALAALSQNKTYQSDIDMAKAFLESAIRKATE